MNFKTTKEISLVNLKKYIFLLSLIFLSTLVCAQEIQNKTWLRLGTGVSILGAGDLRLHQFDTELQFRFNRFFALNSSFTYGYGVNNIYTPAVNMRKGNLNLFLAPLTYNRKFQLEIGGGLAYYNVSKVRVSRRTFVNGELVETIYEESNTDSFGYNMIVENSFAINDKYRLGLKLYVTPYRNHDIHSGVELKWGIRL